MVLVLLLVAATLVGALAFVLGSRDIATVGPKGKARETVSVPSTAAASRASGAGGSEPRVTVRPEGESAQRRARVVGKEPEDPELIEQIRKNLVDEPSQALRLIAEHERRYPDSPNAEMRDGLRVFAWSNMGMAERARSAAVQYLARHPEGKLADMMHRRAHGRGQGEPPRQIVVRDETAFGP